MISWQTARRQPPKLFLALIVSIQSVYANAPAPCRQFVRSTNTSSSKEIFSHNHRVSLARRLMRFHQKGSVQFHLGIPKKVLRDRTGLTLYHWIVNEPTLNWIILTNHNISLLIFPGVGEFLQLQLSPASKQEIYIPIPSEKEFQNYLGEEFKNTKPQLVNIEVTHPHHSKSKEKLRSLQEGLSMITLTFEDSGKSFTLSAETLFQLAKLSPEEKEKERLILESQAPRAPDSDQNIVQFYIESSKTTDLDLDAFFKNHGIIKTDTLETVLKQLLERDDVIREYVVATSAHGSRFRFDNGGELQRLPHYSLSEARIQQYLWEVTQDTVGGRAIVIHLPSWNGSRERLPFIENHDDLLAPAQTQPN